MSNTLSFGKRLRRPVLVTALLSGIVASLLAVALYCLDILVFLPEGTISEDAANSAKWFTIVPGMPLFLVSLASRYVLLFCLFAVLIVIMTRRYGKVLIVILCIALAFLEITLIIRVERAVYDWHFRKVFTAAAERNQPLVEAIEGYRAANGEYPPDLDGLVPDFLPEIPGTGLAGYPEFEYNLAKELGGYRLRVNTPSGGFNWDVFVYWPRGDYPEYFEIFDGWAYVHE